MSISPENVVGIDLGSTYSVVGYVDEADRVAVTRNSWGNDTTPSVVYFENEGNVVVGQVAKEAAGLYPDQVVSLIKREMGERDWRREFFGTEYTPSSISAIVLDALAKDAEAVTGRKVTDVVITVPAYFGLLEREATRQAGEIAGLNVIGIVPEPVAAALHYGVSGNADGTVFLVYDLGGATFDVTLGRMTDDTVEVLVVGGDHRLGGADWDQRLFDYIVDQTIAQCGDESLRDDEAMLQELRTLAETTKRDLSRAENKTLIVRYTGTPAKITVTRKQFEQMTADLLEETIRITTRTLAEVEQKFPGIKAQISEFLLVGGSSKMPAVAKALRLDGWAPRLADPDLAVAKGAALYAVGNMTSHLVTDDAVRVVAEETGISEELVGTLGSSSINEIVEVVAASSFLATFVKELVVKAADDVYSTLKRLKVWNREPPTSHSARVIIADHSARVMLELPTFMNDTDQESLSTLLRRITNITNSTEHGWLKIIHSGDSTIWIVSLVDSIGEGAVSTDIPLTAMRDYGRASSVGGLLANAQLRIAHLEKERNQLRGMVKYLAAEIELDE